MEFTLKWNRYYSTNFKETHFRHMKFYLMKWFGYELEHNYWKFEKNLNSKNFKEHWNIKACFNEQLCCHGVGHEDLYNIPSKRKRLNMSYKWLNQVLLFLWVLLELLTTSIQNYKERCVIILRKLLLLVIKIYATCTNNF